MSNETQKVVIEATEAGIKAFKDLIADYEGFTEERVKKAVDNVKDRDITFTELKENLTGFGSKKTCSLCSAIDLNFDKATSCAGCVWFEYAIKYQSRPGIISACVSASEGTRDSYKAIEDATTADALVEAYGKRAEHMKSVIEALGYENA